jgi:hypothetical protein
VIGAHGELVFASKRDWWIVVLLWASVLVSLVSVVAALRAEGATRESLFPLLLLGFVWGLVMWVLYGTHYTLTAELLLIRSGPMRYKVPLAEIEAVRSTRNPLSSPALSLDRLEITYGRRRIMISPEDKPRFLTELRARCPRLGEEA